MAISYFVFVWIFYFVLFVWWFVWWFGGLFVLFYFYLSTVFFSFFFFLFFPFVLELFGTGVAAAGGGTHGVEIGLNDPLAGRRLLDLRDERRPPRLLRHLFQCPQEAAHLHRSKRAQPANLGFRV